MTHKQWYPKELCKLTNVSVRALHHYDRIGLLKPSVRLSNGYRLYSEKDLLRLQQIVALKFFGFELAQIKTLLANHQDALEHFALQANHLREQAESLMQASKILANVTKNCRQSQSIPWETILKLIEVYQMTQQIENTWVQEIFNADELKQYAEFEEGLKHKLTSAEKKAQEVNWRKLTQKVKANIVKDPTSAMGIAIGKECMEVTHKVFGHENIALRNKIFERGFGEGIGLKENYLTEEMVDWLEQAVNAYWQQCIRELLTQVGKLSDAELLSRWNDIMDDMYGNDVARKTNLVKIVLDDSQIPQEAKTWLVKIYKKKIHS